MQYSNTVQGKFISRLNRFIAKVEIEGYVETVHVKNTGRCKELLLPGVKVILTRTDNPNRKTKYDLVGVYKASLGLINIDSQAPNKVVAEWLAQQDYDYIKPEFTYGNSRIDFYMEKQGEKYLMEVKGCTLEQDGIGYFPDAPTERGVKHLGELVKAVRDGYKTILAYVIQMPDVKEVKSNVATHPEYGQAVEQAKIAGVKIIYYCCALEENSLTIVEEIFAK